MHPSPSPVVPARPKARARALRAYRLAVPVLVTGSLIASAAVVVGAVPASAADNGTSVIGGAPVALNQAADPELGAIAPSADAADNGMYGSLAPWPVIALHATLARNGHLVTFGTPINTVAQSGVDFDDWDPSAGLGAGAHTNTAAAHGYDSFCNSAVTLEDGRILMVSGQLTETRDADMMTMLYDPNSRGQTMGADLAYERWYPTGLRLPDNRILLLGGAKAGHTSAYLNPGDNSAVATVPEIGTGTGAWTSLTGAASADLFGAEDNRWWYPRAFNGPNGTVVGTSGDRIWELNANGAGSVQQTGVLPYNPKVSGSQVMYAPGKILIAGGGQVNNNDPVNGTAQAVVLDVSGAPQAAFTDAMHFGRNWLNLTVLPTGEVLANGGTAYGTEGGDANSVRQSEVWNPATGSWRTAATAQMTRTYHSTSLLLPSGAVFTGGGGSPGPVDNFNAEMYYPSYLFTKTADGGSQWASRPAITSIAGSATYGGDVALTIGDGRAIASASLISMPSVTHSMNTDQRRIPLAISQQGGTVTASLPGSVNTMPPGDYQLTVVDRNGVPSTSQVVTIRTGQAGLVTVSTGTAAAAPAAPVADPAAPVADPAAPVADPAAPVAQPAAPVGAGTGASNGGTAPVSSTVKLTKGASIGLESAAKSGQRVSHSGATVTVKKAGSTSTKAVKRATSWTVRAGLGSKKGYSFESVDKPGYYLVAPSDGSGRLTLAKRSKKASFVKRATFSAVTGVMGHDVSFRLTSKPTQYVQVSGSKVVVKTVDETSKVMMAATFEVPKGLASRR